MNFYILLLITILFFTAFTFARRLNDNFVLIAVAIGCACNANYYTPLNMPIVLGPITFGIDSLLYTLFIFTIVIKALKDSVKSAKIMTITAVVAIMISGIIEFSANISFNGGFKMEYLLSLGKYAFSVIGTLLGVWLMLLIYDKGLKNVKHHVSYLTIFIGITVACLLNANIYYAFVVVIEGGIRDNSLSILLGNYIGKLFCILLAMLSYFVYDKLFNKQKEEVNNG